jgi:hypothetical protein
LQIKRNSYNVRIGEKVAKHIFRESAVEWLGSKEFGKEDIERLQEIINIIASQKKDDPVVILPKNTTGKVAAMAYLLDSITDVNGNLACIDEKGLIEIPEEAQTYYDDDVRMQELEESISTTKIKRGRHHSSAKRRSSVKKERY